MAIERAEIERLAKDRDDEKAIQERSLPQPAAREAAGPQGDRRVQGHQGRHADRRGRAERASARRLAPYRRAGRRGDGGDRDAEARVRCRGRPAAGAVRQQGREAAARRRAAARRDEDGQGVHRGEAQAAARRQDGRPPRQQGRGVARGAGGGHAVPRGRHLGRSGAEPARCAKPDECRADPGDASRLGVPHARRADRRTGGRVSPHRRAARRSAGAAARRLRRGGVPRPDREPRHRPADGDGGEPEEGRADRHAGVRRRADVRHRRHAGARPGWIPPVRWCWSMAAPASRSSAR